MEHLPATHGPKIDIAEVLRKGVDKEGVPQVRFVVEQWHADTFPQEVSEKGFEDLPDPVKRRNVYGLAEACRMYYTGYVLDDPFGNDEVTRIEWQTQMLQNFGEEFHSFQRRIKLRLGAITSVLGLFRGLVESLDASGIHTEEAEEARRLFSQLPPVGTFIYTPGDPLTYEKMSYERKLELVGQIDGVAGRFLELVTHSARSGT